MAFESQVFFFFEDVFSERMIFLGSFRVTKTRKFGRQSEVGPIHFLHMVLQVSTDGTDVSF